MTMAEPNFMTPEISETFLQRMVDALQESAGAQRASAEAMRGLTDHIASLEHDQRTGREAAVLEVKEHVTKDVTAREAWWRHAFVLWASAMVVATILGVPVGRIIAAMLKIK